MNAVYAYALSDCVLLLPLHSSRSLARCLERTEHSRKCRATGLTTPSSSATARTTRARVVIPPCQWTTRTLRTSLCVPMHAPHASVCVCSRVSDDRFDCTTAAERTPCAVVPTHIGSRVAERGAVRRRTVPSGPVHHRVGHVHHVVALLLLLLLHTNSGADAATSLTRPIIPSRTPGSS